MHTVVTGAAGRLGSAFTSRLNSIPSYRLVALTRDDLDVTDRHAVSRTMRHLKPAIIVNCAAYNAVDAAESQASEAFSINADGPRHLAAAAQECGAVLVHFSTDFVFDGEATTPYPENAPRNPLSVYGASKRVGEDACLSAAHHYILRLASLFGGDARQGQPATIDRFIDAIQSGRPLHAVGDRTVTPSYVNDVVKATLALLEHNAPYGTYHCVNSGSTTWFDLAKEAARRLNRSAPIERTAAGDLQTIARRPRFCALSNEKLSRAGISMPSWQSALALHLAERTRPTHAAGSGMPDGTATDPRRAYHL
jgi:dTDP-4-dehydrorhamnose reductase